MEHTSFPSFSLEYHEWALNARLLSIFSHRGRSGLKFAAAFYSVLRFGWKDVKMLPGTPDPDIGFQKNGDWRWPVLNSSLNSAAAVV
jgi:hypothetical protein